MASVQREMIGAVCCLRYANPDRGEMTAKGASILLAAVDGAIEDPAVRAIIITGSDNVFVRHYQVEEILKASDALVSGAIDESAFQGAPFEQLTSRIANAGKPVIAAINGTCMGGGFELALACDLRIAESTVEQIGLPEARLNIFPGGGGTQRLARLIGEGPALEFILRGRVVSAPEAQRLGLINDISDDAASRAIEIAEELSRTSSQALAAIKRLVRSTHDQPLEKGMSAEQAAFAEILKTEEAREAMQSYTGSAQRDIAIGEYRPAKS